MNVYVVGAGAVGTYLGELLRAAGAEVAYAPRALRDVEPTSADLVIVAVKAFATAGAIATLERAHLRSDAIVMTPQNGVGNEELLAHAFGAERICAAALTVPVERSDDGTVVAANRGGLVLAPVAGARLGPTLAAFSASGLRASVVADYRALKWSKLALNIIANASCAILDVLPAQLVTYPDVFDVEIEAVREVRRVMRALGVGPIDLPRYPVRALFAAVRLPRLAARLVLARRIAGARGRKPPSLLLDVRAGRGRTEIDALNGAVADAARRTGVSAPVNTAIARLADAVARDARLSASYRDSPHALVDAVAHERREEAARRNNGR